MIEQHNKNFQGIAGVVLMSVLAVTALSSCTMISKEMLPGIEYRENPNVEIIEYDDHAKLQECSKKLEECTKQVDLLYERWETLERKKAEGG